MKRLFLCTLLLVAVSCGGTALAQKGQFLYLSDQRIITVEWADEQNLVLNYINLGDSFEVLLAHQLVLVDTEGRRHRGHLFRLEDPPDPAKQFEVTQLVRPGEFSGYLVAGNFDFPEAIEAAYFRIAGRVLRFEKIAPEDFELVAARIGELDLDERDRKLAIQLAGFNRGFGELYFAGSPEAEQVQDLFPDEEILPPVLLANPAPRLPSSESDLSDPVVVRVSATVSRAGGLMNVEPVEGENRKLMEIAAQTVQNSWIFLPAISGNEIAQAEMKLNVVFKR